MTPNGRVAVVGSLNVDLVVTTDRLPGPGETRRGGPLQTHPGGKSANQAVAASLGGAAVTLVGAVGDDSHGAFITDRVRRAGVNTDRVRRVAKTATGTAVITVDAAGENTIVISAGANAELTPDDVARSAASITGAAALGLSFEVPLEVVAAAAATAKAAGVTVVLNPSPFAQPPAELLRDVDVLVLNQHELAQLGPAAENVGRLVVTLGADGARVVENGVVTDVPAVAVDAVDTTGCGDAFLGTILAGLAAGSTLIDAANKAALVAAYAATGRGAAASYPNAAQLAAFAEQRG